MTAVFDTSQIVILDTEYTSWPGCIENGWDTSRGQYREIVQIAAVLVDVDSLTIEDSFNELIRPQINPQLSEYFVSLTGIQQKEIASSPQFETVARSFQDWRGSSDVYTWGDEIEVLNENVQLYNADVSFEKRQFYDIRSILETYGIPVDEYTSGTVSEFFNTVPEQGTSHNALYDCKSLLLTVREAHMRSEEDTK